MEEPIDEGVVATPSVAWDPETSVMPQWSCDLPAAGASVPNTSRVYASQGDVQNLLDAECNTCHDGMKGTPQYLGAGNVRNRLYRWTAYDVMNTAAYAGQIVESLKDDGDGIKSSSSLDGAMWNLASIDATERQQLVDFFQHCIDHPKTNVQNHYLTGRSFVTGINYPNPSTDPTQPAGNTCDWAGNNCVVDEQGLALSASAAEMARFYEASNQGHLDTLGKWIAERTPRYIRRPGESIDAFRDRTQTAVYFNLIDLSLGRELWCDNWPANCSHDPRRGPACNLACGVTNYGFTHNDATNALATGIRRRAVKNTVVISYDSSLKDRINPITNASLLGAGYSVQFAAFGPTGARLDKAQLDFQGGRPASYICTNCHGGWYDPTLHLVYQAKLLPANPHDVRFTDAPEIPLSSIDSGQRYTRAQVQSKLHQINELMYNWVQRQADPSNTQHYSFGVHARMMLPAQIRWFEAMYCGNTPGCAQGNGNGGPYVFTDTVQHIAPQWMTNGSTHGWNTYGDWPCGDPKSQLVRDLYHHVVQPYCIGCHNAFLDEPYHGDGLNHPYLGDSRNNADFGGGNPLVEFARFQDHWGGIEKNFIRNGRMPHSEHALKAFWTRDLTTDGTPAGEPLPTYDCEGNINGYLTDTGERTGKKYASAKELLYHHMLAMGGLQVPEPMPRTVADATGPVNTCAAQTQLCGNSQHSGRACVNHACVDRCDTTIRCPVPINSQATENPNRTQCVAATNTCEPCGRVGQKVCLVGAATNCNTSLNPGCMEAGLTRCELFATEFSAYSDPDELHSYGDVNRCLIDLAAKDPREIDHDITKPGLIPSTSTSPVTYLPTSNGTPGFATTGNGYPVPAGATPVFAGFTLASTLPSASAASTFCPDSNCKERAVDGASATYFDSTWLHGGYLEIDFGRNRNVFAVEIQRETVASTLLDDTNIYLQADGGAWTAIPAANGYGSGSKTINGFPPNKLSVIAKVPSANQLVRKVRVRRDCVQCSKQIRISELRVWGY